MQPIGAYLKERPWRFSRATSGQVMLAIGLGGLNLVGALVLGRMLADGVAAASIGGLVAFVQSIYWVLLAYGCGFLIIPLVRYFWIQSRNRRIEKRNEQRQSRAIALHEAPPEIQEKLAYVKQFAAEHFIDQKDLVYTTEKDLLEQEAEQADRIDAEWQRRLEEGH
jgi:hypothetical protein